MNPFFKKVLHSSPFLRHTITGLYKHTNMMLFFGKERCAMLDAERFIPDFDAPLWSEQERWGPPCSILPHVRVLWKRDGNFSGARVALLAHWDKDNILDPYVRHYATHLRGLGFEPVLTSAGPLEIDDADRNLFSAVVYRQCPGYDFTSWKAAFEAFPDLSEAHEIFLANDSVFAPIGDFRPIFQSMAAVPCDFWGTVETHAMFPHLQSYALLLRKNAVSHPALADFFRHVPAAGERRFALGHELRFRIWLTAHGLSAGAWLPASALPWPWFNPLHRTWKQMVAFGLPIMKRDMFLGRPHVRFPYGWERIARRHGYPVELINNYLRRVQTPRTDAAGWRS